VGGITEYLSDEKSALLIPINDIEALTGAIDRVFSDGDLATRIGSQAAAVFDEEFNIKKVIKKTEKVYEDCLEKNGKIKLLEVATTLDTGGVTTHIVDLVTRLPSDKFDISLASGSEGQKPAIVDRVNGSLHYQVGLTKSIDPIQDLKATWDLYRLIKRERFDVVHAHMLKAEVIASLAAKLTGIPYMVSTKHGGRGPSGPAWKQTSLDCIQGIALRYWHDRVIGVSESVSQEVLRKSGMSKDKIETVLNGIDLANYEVDQPRDVVRAALGLTEDQPLIVMVGRLVEQKSPMTLIEAMRDVAKAWPNVQCLFIGDGPARQEMQEAIDRFAVGEWVRILGHRDDVADILNASDIFVLCTKYEGLSIAVLEAMVMSLPVVGTDVPGMDELIEHGETGLLIPENDPTACADAICSLLESPERLQRMGEQAHEHVSTRHTVDIMVRQTEVVLSR
jgi:glycosyltransferase involved in cell wall biosynthesis